MDEVIARAKKYLDEIRNDLVIENCKRQDQCDTDILLTVIDINELEKRLDRVHYNWTQDFVNRFKANPSECLHELRTQRAISNMFFDFVMDFAKVGLAEIPPERTVRQLSEFITFWIKEHFKRGCDERKSGPEYRLTLDELAQRYSEGKPA